MRSAAAGRAAVDPQPLAVRLRRLIAGIDPRHYERRYRKALRDRTVCAWLDRHGTAIISAHGLTPAQAQAAIDRINTLAHATRRAGHPSTLDQIRTDLAAGLLDGTLHHLTQSQIIAHLIAHRSANDDAPDTPHSAPRGTANSCATDEPTAGPPDHSGSGVQGSSVQGSSGEGSSGESSAVDSTDGQLTPRDGAGQQPAPEHHAPEHHAPEHHAPELHASEHDASDGGAGQDQRRGVELRVALSTLLGHDDHPGEIAGLGPVPASHARDVVARQRRAEWRWVLTDTDGRLLDDGITRRRPTGLSTTGPPGGIVELHVPAHTLPKLAQQATGALAGAPDGQPAATWAPVIADIARHHANRDKPHPNKPHRNKPHRNTPHRNTPERPELDAHPDDRLPRAALRRHIHIRDRTCVGVGCRHRPSHCDQDHTVAVQDGGTTVAADLGPLCRHDHTLKTNGGWTLVQPTPGSFVWTSPLRGRYPVQPEPVLPPLPESCPAPDDPEHDEPAPASEEVLMIWKPTPPRARPTTPKLQPSDPDEPAPF